MPVSVFRNWLWHYSVRHVYHIGYATNCLINIVSSRYIAQRTWAYRPSGRPRITIDSNRWDFKFELFRVFFTLILNSNTNRLHFLQAPLTTILVYSYLCWPIFALFTSVFHPWSLNWGPGQPSSLQNPVISVFRVFSKPLILINHQLIPLVWKENRW